MLRLFQLNETALDDGSSVLFSVGTATIGKMISVVIPLYQGTPFSGTNKKSWTHLLRSLSHQKHPFELVIVESVSNKQAEPLSLAIGSLAKTEGISLVKFLSIYFSDKIPSRAEAINLGISKCQYKIIQILHDDMILPENAFEEILGALKCYKAGFFLKTYSMPRFSLSLYLLSHWLNLFRSRICKAMVGSNALFFRRELWEIHPFQGEFMEDIEFSDWLLKELNSSIYVSSSKVIVSSRTYFKTTPMVRILLNILILGLYRYTPVPLTFMKAFLYSKPLNSNRDDGPLRK